MGKTIAIDCFKLAKGYGKSIGIFTVTEKIIQHISMQKTNINWVVFGNKDNAPYFNLNNVRFIKIPFNYKNKVFCVIWELFLVKYYIKKYAIDKILFPRGFAPVGNKNKCIIVVHDMIPFYYQKFFPKALNLFENLYIMYRLRVSIKKSGVVITISQYSKREIERIVPESRGKVVVIYHGYDSIMINERRPIMQDEYILAVTSNLPHKNAFGILKAYEIYYRNTENPVKLIMVGIDSVDKFYPAMDLETKKSIICKTYLENELYYSLFEHAKAFLFLSLIEGFGLPPLEAMQFGVPSVVSNRSCLPEIAGDGALLVEPENVDEVAKAMQMVLMNEKIREVLIENGVKNLERFRWERQIHEYIKVIDM